MKTIELQGAALDWAVAQCEGVSVEMSRGGWCVFDAHALPKFADDYNDSRWQAFHPSIDWAQGGLIIERERISLEFRPMGSMHEWIAFCGEEFRGGEAPLIAAMRCYIASKLGDDLEIPEELFSTC